MSFTRRSMLKATLAALPAHAVARDPGQPASPVPVPVPVDAAHAFLANRVRLLPGSPFHVRQELHRKGVLASYDPDRLLYHYRALAKLPQKEGIDRGYDGSDSEFLRGHMTGHYLSAASRMAAAPVPDIVGTSGNPADWLAPLPGDPSAFMFKDAGPATGILVRPLFDLHHQRYAAYWRLRQ